MLAKYVLQKPLHLLAVDTEFGSNIHLSRKQEELENMKQVSAPYHMNKLNVKTQMLISI